MTTICLLSILCLCAKKTERNDEVSSMSEAYAAVISDTLEGCDLAIPIPLGKYYFAIYVDDEVGIYEACSEYSTNTLPSSFTLSCSGDYLYLPEGSTDDSEYKLQYDMTQIASNAEGVLTLTGDNGEEFELKWLDRSKGVVNIADLRDYADHPSDVLIHESYLEQVKVFKQSCIECRGIKCTDLSSEELLRLARMKKIAGLWIPKNPSTEDPKNKSYGNDWFQGNPLQANDTILIKANDDFAAGYVKYLNRRGIAEYEEHMGYSFHDDRIDIAFSYYETTFDYQFNVSDTSLMLSGDDTVRLIRVSSH